MLEPRLEVGEHPAPLEPAAASQTRLTAGACRRLRPVLDLHVCGCVGQGAGLPLVANVLGEGDLENPVAHWSRGAPGLSRNKLKTIRHVAPGTEFDCHDIDRSAIGIRQGDALLNSIPPHVPGSCSRHAAGTSSCRRQEKDLSTSRRKHEKRRGRGGPWPQSCIVLRGRRAGVASSGCQSRKMPSRRNAAAGRIPGKSTAALPTPANRSVASPFMDPIPDRDGRGDMPGRGKGFSGFPGPPVLRRIGCRPCRQVVSRSRT